MSGYNFSGDSSEIFLPRFWNGSTLNWYSLLHVKANSFFSEFTSFQKGLGAQTESHKKATEFICEIFGKLILWTRTPLLVCLHHMKRCRIFHNMNSISSCISTIQTSVEYFPIQIQGAPAPLPYEPVPNCSQYIEDIYSFDVNTINIVIECIEKYQYFHECEARVKMWMFSLHEMKIFMVSTEKE